jgi:hypothetical protein
MRALLAVALLVLLAVGGALFMVAGDEAEPGGRGSERVEPPGSRQDADEVQPPTRSRGPGESRRPPLERERPTTRGRPAARERAPRPGELRLSDRPECRVPDAFDVPGCSSHP